MKFVKVLMDMPRIDFFILFECLKKITFYKKKPSKELKNAMISALKKSDLVSDVINNDFILQLKELQKQCSQQCLEIVLEVTKTFVGKSSKNSSIGDNKKIELNMEFQSAYFDLLFQQNIILANAIQFKIIDEPQIDVKNISELKAFIAGIFSPELFEMYRKYIDKEILKQICSWSTGKKVIDYPTAQSYLIIASFYSPLRARSGLNALMNLVSSLESYKTIMLSNLLNLFDQNKIFLPADISAVELHDLQQERRLCELGLISALFYVSSSTNPIWMIGWKRLEKVRIPTLEDNEGVYWNTMMFVYKQLVVESLWLGKTNNNYERCKQFFKKFLISQIKIPDTALSKKPSVVCKFFVQFFERQIVLCLLPSIVKQQKKSLKQALAAGAGKDLDKIKQKHQVEFLEKLKKFESRMPLGMSLKQMQTMVPNLAILEKEFLEFKFLNSLESFLDLMREEHFSLFLYKEIEQELTRLLNAIKVLLESDLAQKQPEIRKLFETYQEKLLLNSGFHYLDTAQSNDLSNRTQIVAPPKQGKSLVDVTPSADFNIPVQDEKEDVPSFLDKEPDYEKEFNIYEEEFDDHNELMKMLISSDSGSVAPNVDSKYQFDISGAQSVSSIQISPSENPNFSSIYTSSSKQGTDNFSTLDYIEAESSKFTFGDSDDFNDQEVGFLDQVYDENSEEYFDPYTWEIKKVPKIHLEKLPQEPCFSLTIEPIEQSFTTNSSDLQSSSELAVKPPSEDYHFSPSTWEIITNANMK